jgi:hypothetical protein
VTALDERWRELVGAAVLGTQRRPPPPPSAADPLLLPAEPAEASLLARAAVLAVARRAAWRPTPGQNGSPPRAPGDDWPVAGPRMRRLLALLLGGRRDLLAEALQLLVDARRRVPPEQLPAVLDAGASDADLRPLVRAGGGNRGGWLAVQHEPWLYAARFADEEGIWRTGTRLERTALLTGLRERDPGRARALLEATFTSEPPTERAVFLRLLGEGLSEADEPLLERALDDRRREVRDVAASLLSRLPGSRLVERTAARLEPLLHRRRTGLEVTLPPRFDEAMARDGVAQRPPAGVGERAFWLVQQLGVVPPSHWSARLDGEPPDLLVAAARSEHGALVIRGLTDAAVRHRDAAWLETFLQLPDPPVERLIPALPTGARSPAVAELLARDAVQAAVRTRALIACPAPWDEHLGRAALAWLATRAQDQRPPDSLTRHAVLALAERLPPVVAPDLPALPSAAAWRQLDDLTSATLRLRGELRAAAADDD